VKLGAEKLRFDLSVWDLKKNSPFNKLLKIDNYILNDLILIKKTLEK